MLQIKPAVFTTKTQQVVVNAANNTRSEQASFDVQSATEILQKKQTGTVSTNSTTVAAEPEKPRNKPGSDQPWFKGTYATVKRIYALVCAGRDVKDTDKDDYLPRKFLERGSKYYCGSMVGELLTDRMIAAIFKKITSAPKNQMLSLRCVQKLLVCAQELNVVVIKVFDNVQPTDIVYSGLFSYKLAWMPADEECNSVEKPFVAKFCALQEKLRSAMAQGKKTAEVITAIKALLFNEVKLMRRDAIAAVLNCFLRDRTILSLCELEALGFGVNDRDVKLSALIIRILSYSDTIDVETTKACINAALHKIEQENIDLQIIDTLIPYVLQQIVNPNLYDFFDAKKILIVSSILVRAKITEEIKIKCLLIISIYLEHQTKPIDQKVANDMALNLVCITRSIDRKVDADKLKINALIALQRIVKLNKSLPENVIEILASNVVMLPSDLANFSLIILGSQQKIVIDVDKLAPKLLEDKVIVIDDNAFDGAIVSALIAAAFASSLEQGVTVNKQSLHYLGQALSSSVKQTRILSAKALFFASLHHGLANEILIMLRAWVKDDVADIAIYNLNST